MSYAAKGDRVFLRQDPAHPDCTPPPPRRSDHRLKRFGSTDDKRAWHFHDEVRSSHFHDLMSGSQTCLDVDECHKYVPLEDLIRILMAQKDELIKELQERLRQCCQEQGDSDKELLENQVAGLTDEVKKSRDMLRKAMNKLQNIDEIVNENKTLQCRLRCSEERVKYLEEKKKHLESELADLRSKSQIQMDLERAQQMLSMVTRPREETGEMDEAFLQCMSLERDELQEKVKKLEKELEESKKKEAEIEMLRKQSQSDSLDKEEMSRENECYRKKLASMKCLEKQIQELKKQGRALADKYKREAQKAAEQMSKMGQAAKELQCLREERDSLRKRVNELASYECQYNKLQKKLQRVDAVITENETLNCKLLALQKLEKENEYLKCRLEDIQEMEMNAAEDKERIMQLQCAVADQEEEMKDLLCQIERLTSGRHEEELERLRCELCEKNSKLKLCEEQLAEIPMLEAEIDELRTKLQSCCREFPEKKRGENSYQKVEVRFPAKSTGIKAKYKTPGEKSSSIIGIRREERVELKDKHGSCQEIIQADSGRAYKVTSEFGHKKDEMSCDEVHSLLQSSKGIISCVLEDMIEHQKEMEELEVCNRSMKEEIESLKSKVGGADKDSLLEEIGRLKKALEEKELEISRLRATPGVSRDGEDVESMKELNRQMKAELEAACIGLKQVANLEKMLEEEHKARCEAESRLRGEGHSRLKDEGQSRLRDEGQSRLKDEGQSNLRDEGQSRLRDEGHSSMTDEGQSRPAGAGVAGDPEVDCCKALQRETDDLKLQIEALNKLTGELKKENELLRELQQPCPDFSKELDEKCALENLLQLLQAELDAFKGQKLSDECEALRKELKRVMEQNCQLKALVDCYRQRLDLEKKSNELNQKKLSGERGRGPEAPISIDGSAPAGRTPADGSIAADGRTPPDGPTAADGKTLPDGSTAADGRTLAGGSITTDGKTPASGSISRDGKTPASGSISRDGKTPAGGSITTDKKTPASGSISRDGETPAGGSITTDKKTPASGSISRDGKTPAGGSITTDKKTPASGSISRDGKTPAGGSVATYVISPAGGSITEDGKAAKDQPGEFEIKVKQVEADGEVTSGWQESVGTAKTSQEPKEVWPPGRGTPGEDVSQGKTKGPKAKGEKTGCEEELEALKDNLSRLQQENENLKNSLKEAEKLGLVYKPGEAGKESEQEKGKADVRRPSEAKGGKTGTTDAGAADLAAADCLKELEKLRKEKADWLKELEQAKKEKDDIAKQLDAAAGGKDAPTGPETAGKAQTTDGSIAAVAEKEKADWLKELEQLRKERDDLTKRLEEGGGKPGEGGPGAEKEKADCLRELEQLRKERDDLTKRLEEAGGGKPGAADGGPAAAEKEKADCMKELEQLRKERDDFAKRLSEGAPGKPGATVAGPAAAEKEKEDYLKELEELRKEKKDLAQKLAEATAGGAQPGSQPDKEKADLLKQLEELKKEKNETAQREAVGPSDLRDRIEQLEAENAEKLKKLMEQHEKELANREKTYNENLTAMKSGYETDIRKLTERHKQSIMRLQELHEDEVQEMNVNYETQMETLQTQSEAAINDVAKGSAAKARKLAEQHSKDLKDAERKFHVALDEKESQYLEELGGLRTTLTKSMQELEALKKKTKQGAEGDVDKSKAQQEREIEKARKVSTKKADAAKGEPGEEKKKLEAQIESLKQQLKDKGRGEGVCECKFSKRKPPKPRDPSSPLDFNEVLEKILEEGLDSLTFNEIALVHGKTCCALEGIVMKSNASPVLELEPPIGDGCPHAPLLEADKQQLLARILDLERAVLQKQRQTQEAIISMEVAIKKERCRLQEVRDLLQNEQRKNSELEVLLDSQTKLHSDLKKERDKLGNQASVHRSLCQEKSKQLDEETKSRKCLEAEVKQLKGTLRQLCEGLDPARGNSDPRKADQLEWMRAKLEQSIHQERRLALQLENETKCRMQLQCQLQTLRRSLKHVVNLPSVESVDGCSQNPLEAKSAKERQNLDQINEKRNKMKTKSAKKQKK